MYKRQDLAREFEPGRDYQRLIELPAGIVSLDGVTNVTLDFDTSEMASTKLNVCLLYTSIGIFRYDFEKCSAV